VAKKTKTDSVQAVDSVDGDRRRLLALTAAAAAAAPWLPALGLPGLGLPAPGASGSPKLSLETLAAAEKVAGLEFTQAERELLKGGVEDLLQSYEALRSVPLPNDVPPALSFQPELPDMQRPPVPAAGAWEPVAAVDETHPEAVAFASIRQLGQLLRSGKVSSVKLTELYLRRLERYGPLLHCVISLTPERALEQARQADRELAAGRDRGPLHGIPWGAKDLLAVAGPPTTWGATPFREQHFAEDAAVVRRLDEAGAVLVAKLSLGALAWGDVWFGGMTRNPWKLDQGSSGSSAGSASATAAGLVAFSMGSETWGSIVSPCSRCGTTGLRPTYGRVSRAGAMALSWSMDKLGPICRSVEDCALVFAAIQGPGPQERDTSVVAHPFVWPPSLDLGRLRVGVPQALFEPPPAEEGEDEAAAVARAQGWPGEKQRNDAVLARLRALGAELVPMELPALPVSALSFILSAEAAAAFDELTRSGRDDELVRQVEQAWPNVFRQSRLIPAVEYIQANRARTLVMREMDRKLEGLDLYVAPPFAGDNSLLTNLTGHPAVVQPHGFREDGTPTSITFVGRLFGEEALLKVARGVQDGADFHRRRPPLA
jgi:Asp-tRNA(Asn)/Glu-tRNA(Gln) amidotransferase A subunit family amidase